MAFEFSKIVHESIEDSIAELCAPYCEPETNQLGLCPTECIPYCSPTCYRSIIGAAIPPLPPDIINKTMIDYDGDEQPRSPPFLTTTLVILAIVFSISFCYSINKLCKAWYSSRREASGQQPQEDGRDGFIDQDHDPEVDHPIWYIRSVGLQSSVIRSIAICKYKKGDGLVEGTACGICLNEFQEDETLRPLPNCKHAFHTPCIDKWLGSHTNCPLCRAGIVINQISLPSPPDQPHGNSGVLEEISQEGVPENQREFERGREHGARESSIEDEAEGDPQFQSAFKISNQDSKEDLENIDVQPLRKSICLDPSPASQVSAASANANPAQSEGNSVKQFGKFDESRVVVVPVKDCK